jgi:ferritin-like metal-binding protein YciE
MAEKTLNDLFLTTLKDIYYAENEIVADHGRVAAARLLGCTSSGAAPVASEFREM